MSFIDQGIILDSRPHGEVHAVVQIFTEKHGRCVGLSHGGQGRRLRPLLQPGNEVAVEWKGRENSLGHFSLEMTQARAAEAMSDRYSLAALGAACAVARAVLPEREAQQRAYRGIGVLLDNVDDLDLWPALMARWELGLLAELGFGLSLDRCVATGITENLDFVSPRSGCAVSAAAAAPYKEKMLTLPGFLKATDAVANRKDAIAGLTLTGFFIETRILHLSDQQLPEARRRVVELIGNAAG